MQGPSWLANSILCATAKPSHFSMVASPPLIGNDLMQDLLPLAERIGALLKERKETIAVAG
jgi:hypothetical protein